MPDSIDLIKIVSVGPQGPPGPGSVVSIATGTGLTGGPISTSGTIALANTAVTPGSYTYTSLTVDAQGRLTAASNGTPVTSFSGGATGLSPVGATSGNVVLAGTLGVGYGGTGATTQQAALNTLSGGVTSGYYLRGNGTNVVLSAIQAGDIPTLNQNTTGSAGSVTNSVTFNNSGSGAASGTTFNGAASQTISYNTLGASPLAGSTSIVTTGTVTTGTWSGSFGAVSGANLTNLTAANLTGSLPSSVLSGSNLYVGTTIVALNRSSANLALTGISSVALPGSTSGTVTLQPAAVAGTTTITLPATTGTVVTTGDIGTVTGAMLADGTIINDDINVSAAIAGTKIAPNFGSQTITTTGVLSLALGTAGAPAAAFTGDLNTGIYSPGADQVAISTGGTGRLFIRSNGKIYAGGNFGLFGVPGDLNGNFTVVGAPPILSLGFDNSATNTADALIGGIQFGDGDPSRSNYAGISVHNANGGWGANNSPTYMRFLTCAVSSNTATERLRIDSSGDVLVNTTTSAAFFDGKLRVENNGSVVSYRTSSTNAGVLLESLWHQATTGNNQFISFGTETTRVTRGNVYYDRTANGLALNGATNLVLATGEAERVRIDSSGRVGIGTSAPSVPLDVASAANSNAFRTQVGGTTFFSVANNSNGVIVDFNDNGGVLRNRIDARAGFASYFTAGNVGIGTSSPARPLHVASSTTYQGILVNGNQAPNIAFDTSTLTGPKWKVGISGNNANNFSISAGAANDDKLVIDSAGRVLINATSTTEPAALVITAKDPGAGIYVNTTLSGAGAASPSYGLFVDGGAYTTATVQYGVYAKQQQRLLAPTYGGYFEATGTYSTNYGIYAKVQHNDTNSSTYAYGLFATAKGIGAAGIGGTYGAYIENTTTDAAPVSYGLAVATSSGPTTVVPFVVSHGGTERMRITSTGNVGIGTTSPAGNLHINSSITRAILINNSTIGTTNTDGTYFSAGSDGGFDIINQENSYTRFGTNGTERVRIDSSGRLLVGTSSTPAGGNGNISKLVIQGYVGGDTGTGIISLQRGQAASALSTGTELGRLAFNDNGGNSFATITCESDAASNTNDYPGRLTFSTTADGAASPTERMRITNAGRVGIGTTTPSVELTISQGATGVGTNGRIALGDVGPGTPSARIDGYRAAASFAGELHLYTSTAGGTVTRAVTIDSTQRVGIGTTSPNAPLEVVGSTNGDQLRINQGGQYYRIGREGSGGLLEFHGAQSGFNGYIFGGANGERARIDSSGRLLVGTTTAVGAADVVSPRGFVSRSVALTLNGTSTVTVPVGCICAMTTDGFPGDSAIFSIKASGGSQGCYVLGQGTAGTIGFGTTSNPSTGTRLNVWISSGLTMSIQDVNQGARTILLTFMSLF